MAPLPLRNQSNPRITVLSFVISFSFCIDSMNKSPRIAGCSFLRMNAGYGQVICSDKLLVVLTPL